MKRMMALCLVWVLILSMAGCARTMNDIIAEEPSITGIVEEVFKTHILISSSEAGSSTLYHVSLDVEKKDSSTHFSVGDEVVVYYNGQVAESYPAQILTVYAILLKTPASREANNRP